MPTIRGYTKGIDDAALKKFIDNYTSSVINIAKKAGLEVMRDLRRSAVNTWYNNSTARNAVNDSTKYEVESVKQNKGKITILFRSYVDEGEFEALKSEASSRNLLSSPYSSVVGWRRRHEKDGWQYYGHGEKRAALPMPKTVGKYMFDLLWEEGIVGLPPHERQTGTGWVNPKPCKEREPMQTYVKGYLKDNWGKKIEKKYRELGIVR